MPRPATSRILDIFIATLLVGLVVSSSEEDDVETSASYSSSFTDQWAVHISGGDDVADAIAAKHGFTNLGKVTIFLRFICVCGLSRNQCDVALMRLVCACYE